MMFNEIILLIFFLTVQVLSQRIIDDIFYGETPFNKNNELAKLREELIKSNKNSEFPIKSLQPYIERNWSNFRTIKKLMKPSGNCNRLLDVEKSLSINSNFTENFENLRANLNDKNFLFNDDSGNIIAYSTCSNFIDFACVPQIFFISKL